MGLNPNSTTWELSKLLHLFKLRSLRLHAGIIALARKVLAQTELLCRPQRGVPGVRRTPLPREKAWFGFPPAPSGPTGLPSPLIYAPSGLPTHPPTHSRGGQRAERTVGRLLTRVEGVSGLISGPRHEAQSRSRVTGGWAGPTSERRADGGTRRGQCWGQGLTPGEDRWQFREQF